MNIKNFNENVFKYNKKIVNELLINEFNLFEN